MPVLQSTQRFLSFDVGVLSLHYIVSHKIRNFTLCQETEGGTTPTAYSEDMSGEAEVKHCLEAMAACTLDDVVHWNWSIELVNSQVQYIQHSTA
jgi:hypothetical protein